VSDFTSQVLVGRLTQWYKSELVRRHPLGRVLRAKPLEFQHEICRWDAQYSAGRIHFLLRQLKHGEELDPIEIEMQWRGLEVTGLVVTDGHHRLAAYILARKRRIPANVSGIVPVNEWLTGARRKCPLPVEECK
jgi:hypothetical protein